MELPIYRVIVVSQSISRSFIRCNEILVSVSTKYSKRFLILFYSNINFSHDFRRKNISISCLIIRTHFPSIIFVINLTLIEFMVVTKHFWKLFKLMLAITLAINVVWEESIFLPLENGIGSYGFSFAYAFVFKHKIANICYIRINNTIHLLDRTS